MERLLGGVIRSRIWPSLDHVEIRPVSSPDATDPRGLGERRFDDRWAEAREEHWNRSVKSRASMRPSVSDLRNGAREGAGTFINRTEGYVY